jgi:hypothetical protein
LKKGYIKQTGKVNFLINCKHEVATSGMSASIPQSPQIDFVAKVLPELFHNSPDQFMILLARDGTKFLRFYWDLVGKKLAAAPQISPFGLNYDIRQPRPHEQVALITLPKPQREGEAYYTALIYRPNRVTPILRISDTTKVIALEYALDVNGNERPLLVEWTRKLQRELLNARCEAKLDDFYAAVLHEISN